MYYNSKQHYLSDHRPVLAIYRMQTFKVDRDKKEQLRRSIQKTLVPGHVEIDVVKEKIA